MYLPRLRRLHDALKEIKESDPNSMLTYHMLIELMKEGKITSLKYGNAWVINLDELYSFLKGDKKKRGRKRKEQ